MLSDNVDIVAHDTPNVVGDWITSARMGAFQYVLGFRCQTYQ